MIHPKRFYMIRHGETEANAAQIMAGSLDSPLTARGRRQAEDARQVLENLETPPTAIVHSHLSRARDTAQILNETLRLPMEEDADLAEIFVGELEGRPYAECLDIFDGWKDSPGGETCAQFFERIKRGKNRALLKYDSPVLIVCHGGVFRAFAKLYGLEIPGVRNCHLHEFTPRNHAVFPWQVSHYDYEDRLAHAPSDLYHAGEDGAASIAS